MSNPHPRSLNDATIALAVPLYPFTALVRLRHGERVPLERVRELFSHEFHRRLKRDHLLSHLRRDHRVIPARFDLCEHLFLVPPSCP